MAEPDLLAQAGKDSAQLVKITAQQRSPSAVMVPAASPITYST